jgi:hypothetical protein
VDNLRVYHFKKLKGNATLTFWLTNSEGLDKWKWIAVFVGAALVVQALFMILDRGYVRVFRRRVVHI